MRLQVRWSKKTPIQSSDKRSISHGPSPHGRFYRRTRRRTDRSVHDDVSQRKPYKRMRIETAVDCLKLAIAPPKGLIVVGERLSGKIVGRPSALAFQCPHAALTSCQATALPTVERESQCRPRGTSSVGRFPRISAARVVSLSSYLMPYGGVAATRAAPVGRDREYA